MSDSIDRRRFVGAVAGGLVVARSVAEAQPAAKVYKVGFLLGATAESVAALFNALDEGLRDLGNIEARNIGSGRGSADGKKERRPGLAAELGGLQVEVIVPGTIKHAAAARAGP